MGKVDHRLPLYQRLRDEIAQKIAEQIWRPGDAIPTEMELATQHKVAIGTVRKAVQTLVDEGLVERFQGRGTFVRRADFTASLSRFFRFQRDDGRPVIPESRILLRQELKGPLQVTSALRLPPDAPVIRLLRQRLVVGQPILAEEIWLSKQRFQAILALPAEKIGPLLYPLYESLCGEIVASAEETLTIEPVSVPFAEMLGLDGGTPVVVIERLAFDSRRLPIEWRQSRAAASTFRYQVEIR
jgi:GntR family transcriptional regulator